MKDLVFYLTQTSLSGGGEAIIPQHIRLPDGPKGISKGAFKEKMLEDLFVFL